MEGQRIKLRRGLYSYAWRTCIVDASVAELRAMTLVPSNRHWYDGLTVLNLALPLLRPPNPSPRCPHDRSESSNPTAEVPTHGAAEPETEVVGGVMEATWKLL